jgi:alkyl hydroperoxide reductase subunit F
MFELMIVGGGPAGMTAAVYAARKKMNAVVVSQDLGGQTNWSASVENYMGYQFVEGPELMHKFEEQVDSFLLSSRPATGIYCDGVLVVQRSDDAPHSRSAVLQ